MPSTELVLFDPVFARSQEYGIPALPDQLSQAMLATLFGDECTHDVNWRFWTPSLDDLDGLDYWDEARRLDPSLVDDKHFLDGFEADHLAETGHLPRAQWYRDARQRQRIAARRTRQARLTREWARGLDGGTFSLGDADDSQTSGTEEFSDSFAPVSKLRMGTWVGPNGYRHTKLLAFDSAGRFIEGDWPTQSRQTVERYRDRSVAETAIFHPVNGDGLTLDEMLSEMKRFELQTPDEWDPLPEVKPVDPHYVAPDVARWKIRRAREVVELAGLKAAAVEICRFPWSEDQIHPPVPDGKPRRVNRDRARGWVRRSRLLEWGSDTWHVILCRKLYFHGDEFDLDDPAHSNHWTVFVRTHTGSETVSRRGKADLQVWTWEPHYYLTFGDEETGTQWLERLEDAFLRERHGDLDQLRWPQDLVNDRSVAAAKAAEQWKRWQRRARDGWTITTLDGPTPGAIEFMPNEAASYDPGVLQTLVDQEYADYEAAQQ